ncbi:MAG: universal stress protein [Terracidiphilus sp.]|nr:universal stress protein [Terracidiphilus sp.]
MATVIKPEWSKPSTILFAAEIPINEKAFGSALAQAAEHGAMIIVFHVSDGGALDLPATSGSRHSGLAQTRFEKRLLEPLSQRAAHIGILCKIVVRQGLPAEQILTFLRERKVDRVVMGAHSPGPVGKLLVGSVAEAVLRKANVPVCIVGPYAVEGTWRNCASRKILCDVSKPEASQVIANFGAELAATDKASLLLQQVIPPQERDELLGDRPLGQLEAELPHLIRSRLMDNLPVQARVVLGDPTEELLYQGRARQANLIVMGAQGASSFAAISRAGMVYKVLAYAPCPVMTLSPVLLADCGVTRKPPRSQEVNYLAGVV